jgi:hypothetical protein
VQTHPASRVDELLPNNLVAASGQLVILVASAESAGRLVV